MIVLTREEQGGPLPGEILFEGRGLPIELCGQLRIGRLLDQLERGEEVVGAALDAAP